MKFAMLYSGGKDSMLALHRLKAQGHEPIALIVMYNEEMQRSWFHGIDSELLARISESLAIPVWECACTGESYADVMRSALERAKTEGAQFVAFGDIDIAEHRAWYDEVGRGIDLEMRFPLWKENREDLVRETIGLGYTCIIKCVDTTVLDESFLGKILDASVLEQLRAKGADLCGENGEYHTIVTDGPLFSHPVAVEQKEKLNFGRTAAMNIVAALPNSAL